MEYRIEAWIVNWQNRFNGGYKHSCKNCSSPIYLNAKGEFKGTCPHCGDRLSITSALVTETIRVSDGGRVGVGQNKIHRKHLIVFGGWWFFSVVVGACVSGLAGCSHFQLYQKPHHVLLFSPLRGWCTYELNLPVINIR